MPLPDPFLTEQTKQFIPGFTEDQKMVLRDSVRQCLAQNFELSLWPNELYRIIQVLASTGYDRTDATMILETHNLLPTNAVIPQAVWTYICRIPLVAASRLQVVKEALASTYVNPVKRINMLDEQLHAIRVTLQELLTTLSVEGDEMSASDKQSIRSQVGYFQTMMLQFTRQISQEQSLLESWIGIKQSDLVGSPEMDASRIGDDVAFAPKVLQGSDTSADTHTRLISAKSHVLEGLRGLTQMPPDELKEKLIMFQNLVGKP